MLSRVGGSHTNSVGIWKMFIFTDKNLLTSKCRGINSIFVYGHKFSQVLGCHIPNWRNKGKKILCLFSEHRQFDAERSKPTNFFFSFRLQGNKTQFLMSQWAISHLLNAPTATLCWCEIHRKALMCLWLPSKTKSHALQHVAKVSCSWLSCWRRWELR